MKHWHKLLLRQLKRHNIEVQPTSPIEKLFDDISTAYQQSDDDRVLLERSLELTSNELIDRNHSLQKQVNTINLTKDDLKKSLNLLQATMEASGEGVIVVEGKERIDVCNDVVLNMFKITREELDQLIIEQPIHKLKETVVNFADIRHDFFYVLNHDLAKKHMVFELSDGKILDCYTAARLVGGECIGRVWNFRDITQLKRSEQESRYNAHHDRLTGLPNRILFLKNLEVALLHNSHHRIGLAVLFLDLDGFKIINDSLGHEVGDELLVQVTQRLEGLLSIDDVLCRHGGDEFVLMLNGVKSINAASMQAERIIQSFEMPFFIEGQDVFITTSLGIALTPMDGDSASLLVRNADMAMYHAKSRGRNNFQFFSDELERLSSHRLKTINDLKQALELKEFHLEYQPKVDLNDGKIIGVEALIRWHKDGKLIPPLNFISIAEDTGLIIPISEWVIETACEQIRDWVAMGFSDIKVAINISSLHFERGDVSQAIEQAVKSTGITYQSLEVELTESAILNDVDSAIAMLLKIRDQGTTIAIDDFGTGYSSLNYLKRLPINIVKIDKSFIDELSDSRIDHAMVFSIITLAHILGYKVVAEGVEDLETLKTLKAMQCDYVQGYYFSEPVSAEKLTQMLVDDVRLLI